MCLHELEPRFTRGDGKTKYKGIRSVLDICQQANVPILELATEVPK